MPLTQEELERRRQFITATEPSALLGINPWMNAADVFYFKTQGLTIKPNAAMEAGNLLEPKVLEWAATKLGRLNEGDWRVSDNGINAASLDSITSDGEPVEAKTTGIVGPGKPEEWGDEGTDEVPDYYNIQVQSQLFVTGAKQGWLAALIGGRGFVLFRIKRNNQICDLIAEVSVKFWVEHIVTRQPPGRVIPSLDTLKKIRRTPNKIVRVEDSLAKRVLQVRRLSSQIDKRKEDLDAEFLNSIGDAEAARWSGGTFTYFETERKGFTVAPSTFRVLRHKEPKQNRLTEAKRVERYESVESLLASAGYQLKDRSESGSRYYVALGKPDIRVSDHQANANTTNWMTRESVREVRIDFEDYQQQLAAVLTSIDGSEVNTLSESVR